MTKMTPAEAIEILKQLRSACQHDFRAVNALDMVIVALQHPPLFFDGDKIVPLALKPEPIEGLREALYDAELKNSGKQVISFAHRLAKWREAAERYLELTEGAIPAPNSQPP